MYIFGKLRDSDKIINAFPCFICKKMIINAGIKRVITSVDSDDNDYRIFEVSDWINDWKVKDIIDDKDQYGK